MTARVIILDYDPLWPQQFQTLRSRIAAVLDELPTAIEHVGSTSVPGLAAKPIIDIDVLLKSSTDFPLVIARLSSVGYEHRGDLGVTGREAFRVPPDDVPHHLYLCPHAAMNTGGISHSVTTSEPIRRTRTPTPL